MYQGFSPLRAAIVVLVVALTAAATTSPLRAQRVSGEALPDRLSLEAAIEYAERWSPQYRIALNDEDVADATVRARQGQYLPTISANVSTSSGGSRAFTGLDPFGNPVRLDEAATFSSSSSSQQVSAQFNIFDFGRRESELRAARSAREAVRADISRERLALRSTVTRLYNEALLAAARVSVS